MFIHRAHAGVVHDPHIPADLGAAQAAISLGFQSLFAAASLASVIDCLIETDMTYANYMQSKYFRAALVASPYIVFLVFVTATATLAGAHPEQVSRTADDLVCVLHTSTLTTVLQISAAAMLVSAIVLATYAIVRRSLTTTAKQQQPQQLPEPAPPDHADRPSRLLRLSPSAAPHRDARPSSPRALHAPPPPSYKHSRPS
ncbi:hypothetical protein BD413DRAFT_115315 [Trametes elegans]|nr:hypothetical protein BD413DRAFT_115315 [Trametes elegans]